MSSSLKSIALCRVSTAEQALTGNSLGRQEHNVHRAAEELGTPIARMWSLDQSSRTGKNLKRKDLAEMLAFCKVNKSIKYLIVDEVDRFMRSIDELYYFEVAFREVGVTVWYASQPELNNRDPMAKLSKLLKVYQAEASNDERINKSTSGLHARVRLGYYPFPLPQGYRKTGVPGLFEPDEPRFSQLRRAFIEVLAGKRPAQALKDLTHAGYVTPGGKPLYLTRFMEILRCPYYCGAIRIAGWDFTNENGLHKRMIPPDEFEELQAILDGKKLKTPRKDHNPAYPLSRLMECAECKGKLVGFLQSNGKGASYHRYRCRGCKRMYARDDVHASLSGLLGRMLLRDEGGNSLIKELEAVWKHEQSGALGRIEVLNARKTGLIEGKAKYLKALAENPDLKESYRELIATTDKAIAGLDEEIHAARGIDEDLLEFARFALDYVSHQKDAWWTLTFEEMERCKHLLFPAGFFIDCEKKVRTPEISPLFRLEGTKKEPLNGSIFDMVDLGIESLHPKLEEAARWKCLLLPDYQRFKLKNQAQSHVQLMTNPKFGKTTLR